MRQRTWCTTTAVGPFAAAVLGLSALVAAAPSAQAASPGTPGLLAGAVYVSSGEQTTATENPDGTGLVTTELAGDQPNQGGVPSWSPDGAWIAYQFAEGGVMVSRPDGTDGHIVNDDVGATPVFSRDGATLIYACGVPTQGEYLCSSPASWDVDAENGRNNATPWFDASTGADDSWPTVAAGTGTVYFQHGSPTSSAVWTDHGTRTPGPLIADAGQPDISPDGSTLAFVRNVGGYDQIFTQDASGTGDATQVTTGAVDHEVPKWTPDGLGLDYNLGKQTVDTTPVGHHLVLAGSTDTVVPGGLFDVAQQPVGADLPDPVAPPAAGTTGAASTFHPVDPQRVLDTRSGIGTGNPTAPLAPGATYRLDPAGVPSWATADVPAYATAVVLNVTVTSPAAGGFLTVYPDAMTRPTSSNLNWTKGETIPNQVVVPVAPDGEIDFYNGSSGSTQVIADVSGYFTGDETGSSYTAAGPTRLLDTRAANGVAGTTPVAPGGTVSLQVAGRGTVPESGATAVVLNVTVTSPRSGGFLTAYPDKASRPTASNLNWTAGQTIANHVIVPVGTDGKVDFYNGSSGTVHVIADLYGYYSADTAASAFHTTGPVRLLDTRLTGHQVPAHGTVKLDVEGTQVPSGATAVVLNVTVTDTRSAGFLTAFPSEVPQPDASNINWVAGQTIPNLVTLPVIGGQVVFANSGAAPVDILADVLGYYHP